MPKDHSEPNQASKTKVSVTAATGLKQQTVFAVDRYRQVQLGWALNTSQDAIEYETFCLIRCHLPAQISLTTPKQRSELCLTPPNHP